MAISSRAVATSASPTVMPRRLVWSAVALCSLVTPACTKVDNALASVPIFAFMREAPSFDAYEHPLPAPPGAVPFASPNGGELLGPLEASEQALVAFAASPQGQNPLAVDDTAALRVGQLMFERHCVVCHGPQGLGDGPIIGPGKFMITPPSLIAAPATTRPDGYIYGVVRAGRGLMPAYGPRMTHTERWAVVNYVNALQAAAGAAPVTAQPVTPQDATALPQDTAAPPQAGAVMPADSTPSQQ